ncbi:MAG TPA: outer membrane protein assembly factor BamA [Alcaligenaceae bacterium]|nr:outer membrane protein assembly factor BamA [Alcaligenaceae bacterium]
MSFSRKKQFALRAVSAALAALLAPLANAFTPFVIQDIQVNGIQRIDPGAVFNFLPVKVGETFDDVKASESIQRLYSSGYFSDVKIDTDNNVLVVTVQERPTIASISFNGMREFNDKNILQALSQVGFSDGRVFDRSMLERAEFELKQQYLAKGKYGVEVTPIITPLPRNRVGISFDVFEGDLAKIKEINIVGNDSIKTSVLLGQMQLTTSGVMTWYTGTNKYAREKLEGDIEAIRSYYLDRGYLEVQIDPPQVSISPDRKDIFVTLTIHEGDQYSLTEVKLAGDLLGLESQLEPLVHVKAGEMFSAEKTNQTVKAITDYLGGLGYAFANINPNPVLDRANKTADLTFYVDPGRRVYVRRIEIGGNVRTRDQVIRREMRQQEAAWYDADAIDTSRDRVDRLGYFTEVDVTTSAVPGTADQIFLLH